MALPQPDSGQRPQKVELIGGGDIDPSIGRLARLAFDLGLAAHRSGDFRTALSRFAEAHESAPHWQDAGAALAHTYERLGLIDDAFRTVFAAAKEGAPNATTMTILCGLLENYPPPPSVDFAPEDFAAVMAVDGVDLRLPARMALATLMTRPPLRDVIALAKTNGFAAAARWALSAPGRTLLADQVFCRALRAGPNTDPAIELLLSEIRRALALDPAQLDDGVVADFAQTLAAQCRLNEFVWTSGIDEGATHAHPLVRDLYPTDNSRSTPSVVFGDPVSRRVAEQYEAHPYPAWTHVNVPIVGTQLAQLRAAQVASGVEQTADAPSVLIAGCGTGQQVVQMAAGLGPNARILAIDLSAASLAYAARKAAEHGFTGIEFRQADILDLDDREALFDIVACTGVLHHMQNPSLGWRALTDRLKPGGAQYIALYSAHARASLDEVRRRFPPDETVPINDRIRTFRRRVIERHAFDWGASGIEWVDFFTLGGCRDLLFHAHEERYTIARLAEELDGLGLRFLEFVVPASVERAFAAEYPNDSMRRDLPAWDRFEQRRPDTFKRMYQFWCAKKSN